MDIKPLNRIKVVMTERMASNKGLDVILGEDTVSILRCVSITFQSMLEVLIVVAKALKCDIGNLVCMDGPMILKIQD